ncbi:MAG: glycosyl hydrolase [Coriobacteriia bacterium]
MSDGVLRLAGRAAATLVAGALVVGLLAGCGGVRVSSTAPPPAATASPTPPVVAEPTTLSLAAKLLPLPKGAYLGVYAPPAPFEASAVASFESAAGKGVGIVMWYQPWARDNRYRVDSKAVSALLIDGKVPLITWEPWDPGSNANQVKNPGVNPTYRLSRIIAGDFDDYIRSWARDLRSLGGPVLLRPMHEMNGNWYPWCGTVNGNRPPEYVQAWRHMHDIFTQEGADNVAWVWSINHESVPASTNNRYAAYYPGDAYVDWTSISGFNWGTSSSFGQWQPWWHWYEKPLTYLETLRKPICISEFATVEQGGDKAAWLLDAYRRIAQHPKVKAVVYYDAHEKGPTRDQDWRMESTTRSRNAFRRAVAPAYFSADAPPALRDWLAALSTGERTLLEGLGR